eukprot:364948-Chlamydomonas_euryale.AAC.17
MTMKREGGAGTGMHGPPDRPQPDPAALRSCGRSCPKDRSLLLVIFPPLPSTRLLAVQPPKRVRATAAEPFAARRASRR